MVKRLLLVIGFVFGGVAFINHHVSASRVLNTEKNSHGEFNYIEEKRKLDTDWIELFNENFESVFPTGNWSVTNTPSTPQIRWDDDDWRSYSGNWAAWPGRGSDGVEPPTPYPNNINTTMKYGPFDLSNCVDAKIEFWKYLYTQPNYDFLYFTASHESTLAFNDPKWHGMSQAYWEKYLINLIAFVVTHRCGWAGNL